jgi:PAS domain S-box-containing protein
MKPRHAPSFATPRTRVENVRSRLAAIVESSNDAIISKTVDGVIATWNPAAQRVFGYSEAEAVGQPITIIIPPELRDEEQEMLQRVRAGERIEHHETRRLTRDGRSVDVSITVSPLKDADGTIVGASKILRNITERKQEQAALRESEERFRLIANTAPVAIWMVDAANQCTYVNQVWVDHTGRPPQAALGRGWTDGIHPDDLERIWTTYANAFDRRQPFRIEYRLRRHDGEYRWMTDAGVPRYDGDGSFAGYIGSATDVTERKLAEAALATIGQRLIEAQEEERARLSRELHDDINQRLVLLSLRLGAMADTQELKEVHHDLVNLVKDIQALSRRLHPPRLEYLGIAAAAAALCRDVSSQQAVEVTFHAEHVPEGLPRRVAMCLYRVLQEALQNAITHSGARKVDVALTATPDQIELTVEDSGVGFDADAQEARGFGLTSMKERLKAIHGRLVVSSQSQRGTSIRARVPLRSVSHASSS